MKQHILILLTLFCFSISYGQNTIVLIDEYIKTYTHKNDFSGCVLVTKQDQILFSQCYGMANASEGIWNDQKTKFSIGSISKQMTATAILLLEEQGLLKTADTISTYFPNSRNAKRITIHQLLSHTSGVIDIYDLPGFLELKNNPRDLDILSSDLLESELYFEPGTRYQYSNGAYTLLASIIEKVSSKEYGTFLSDHIFKPLKMYETGHSIKEEIVVNRAIGYNPLAYDDLELADPIDFILYGSGSIYSTNTDIKKWINAIKQPGMLNQKSWLKFLKNYGNNYGYGISIYKSQGKEVFGHDGRLNGFIADYLHYLEDDISIIITGNIQSGVADFFREDIAAIVFGKTPNSKANTIPQADHIDFDITDILGIYAFAPNFKVYVDQKDNRILARANEGAYSEMILLKDGRFFNRTLYSFIKFEKSNEGEVNKMIWINNEGGKFEGIKEN